MHLPYRFDASLVGMALGVIVIPVMVLGMLFFVTR
jgi:hypothetical protein